MAKHKRADSDYRYEDGGDLAFFKRPNSKCWQVRGKLSNGEAFMGTTGEHEYAAALIKARKMQSRKEVDIEDGRDPNGKMFRAVSDLWLKELAKDTTNRQRKIKDYTRIVETYYDVFFEKYRITEVTQAAILNYEEWRRNLAYPPFTHTYHL